MLLVEVASSWGTHCTFSPSLSSPVGREDPNPPTVASERTSQIKRPLAGYEITRE